MSKAEVRPTRTVFFVSDQTGITAETLGHSLLTQFDGIEFQPVTVPFIRTVDKARELAERIDRTALVEGRRPLVFGTLLAEEIRAIVKNANCLYLDFIDTFIEPIEQELGAVSTHTSGRAHAVHERASYMRRIDAMNYALAHDDGAVTRHYHRADVILVGVSRSGKTPTCLYLALRYGVFAANYPLTEEDLARSSLPAVLLEHKHRLFGLTIDTARLQSLRNERRPESRYASARQVDYEVKESEALFRRHGVPYFDVTHCSIEEIATTVLHMRGLARRVY